MNSSFRSTNKKLLLMCWNEYDEYVVLMLDERLCVWPKKNSTVSLMPGKIKARPAHVYLFNKGKYIKQPNKSNFHRRKI